MENFEPTGDLRWTISAQTKLKMIPFFARPQARQKIEEMTRAAELEEVTAEIVERARAKFGQ